MKTLTPQTLAFYLGCDAQYIDEDKNELIMPILAVNLQGFVWFVDPEFDEAIEIKDVKPILRKLSSMTEDEAVELLLIVFRDKSLTNDEQITSDEIEVDLHLNDGGLMVDGDMALVIEVWCRCYEGQLGITLNGSLALYDETNNIERIDNTIECFHYLLSKHFDLFGLIEAGLAIDKEELK